MNDYMSKPIRVEELEKAIKNIDFLVVFISDRSFYKYFEKNLKHLL